MKRAAAAASPAVTVRTCSMVESGCLTADYRRRALILAPLALGNLRTYAADQSLPGQVDARYRAYELIATVSAGARPVLSLPRSEWRTVGLLYDPSQFRGDGAYRLQDLAQDVRFRACESPNFNHGVSQFDGGFAVTHAQCVRFLVTIPPGRTYLGGVSSGRAVPQSVVFLTSAPFAERSACETTCQSPPCRSRRLHSARIGAA